VSADVIRSHLRNGEWELARRAAAGALQDEGPDDPGVLHALLSRAWYRLGQPRKALEEAEQGAALSDHWEVSLALGEALVATGDPLPARAILQAALETAAERGKGDPTWRASADEEAPWRAADVQLRTALAEACRAAGTPEEGLAIAARAEALAEVRFGAHSLETAEALFAMGVCMHGVGQDTSALETLQRALQLRRADNPEHTDVAATLDALGVVQRARGKPFEAVELHREALELWSRRLGSRASPVGACRYSLAQALHNTGDFLAAREQMRLAYAITLRTLGEDHVDTWITRFELGRFEVDCGEMEIGFQAMEEARKVVRERLGAEHPFLRAMDRWL